VRYILLFATMLTFTSVTTAQSTGDDTTVAELNKQVQSAL
jgi:hypothetical protein